VSHVGAGRGGGDGTYNTSTSRPNDADTAMNFNSDGSKDVHVGHHPAEKYNAVRQRVRGRGGAVGKVQGGEGHHGLAAGGGGKALHHHFFPANSIR